ncbi:hypothetical protein [Vibrio parahaemolyticus]|nr:hypothetical protein [Vibrio parahaemolyticus]EHK4783244.1 hypothetical protein [Vibrio parahaemolyticus]EIJ0973762.1 hypothetical protein [Vibrio parahaemolyticus]EJO4005663.1 hypothetical protein [Vibrio parahaemolyticus]MBM4987794.1 hypothetical protein [Vibrio parahaemolyticus]MBM4992226.1 hypothetical protein [Vibrio parahaemolyticus]
MAFDTTVFEQKYFSGANNKVEELLSHLKAVLLGARVRKSIGLSLQLVE